MLTSSLACNIPKLRFGRNNKSLYMGVKDPKCSSVSYTIGNRKANPDTIHDILCGRMVQEEGLVFQQELVVRSFDIGIDSKMSIVAWANYLQKHYLTILRR
ncbi:hypothetical protein ERO13_D07G235550v2 [Gossypium hirsutum]|uniref:Uncharacterized protein n=3 Tax=Gossypium TaxID=3633 RepID=A0A5D2UET4_GOSMU|nr:hypothetical protein ERO13_D07G235550v2 [Gossypium hirsutum]TYG63027.1 hypothetical protein ES288_D07G278800v1 [Gossypium darwinii]TYH64593.1 hypothetical protein ES332_D07G277400v1 [Gossypium tomentosum]TYI75315.1 hypothetical protein E1A91_D07G266200v1 [Gossypium mustelinum]